MCIRHAFRDSRDPLFARMIDTIVQMYEYNLIKAEPWNMVASCKQPRALLVLLNIFSYLNIAY